MFGMINSFMVMSLCATALIIFIMFFSIYRMYRNNKLYNSGDIKEKPKAGTFVGRLNENEMVKNFGDKINNQKMEALFNRAKNPWGMTVPTFQVIRFGGLLLSLILAAFTYALDDKIAMFCVMIGVLCAWYPMYYYKAIGQEREAEWSKMYEFIWVVKHNLMLYDPAKTYMNVKIYIEEHAPHNKEIIQGFDDFYTHWDPNTIDQYVEKYYPFSITREITQIVFNANKTGDFPEESLTSLRQFIINQQDLTVSQTLSAVAGKATIFSLPFLMISVILALMVPLGVQIMSLM